MNDVAQRLRDQNDVFLPEVIADDPAEPSRSEFNFPHIFYHSR